MRSADLIREARLRAGLTQYELAERSGRDGP
jgi:transcriptional regulator with XRE-family HTH domain